MNRSIQYLGVFKNIFPKNIRQFINKNANYGQNNYLIMRILRDLKLVIFWKYFSGKIFGSS